MSQRRTYPWPAIIAGARARSGEWALPIILMNAPTRIVGRIRARAHPDLRVDDGVLEARMTNRYTDELGRERADVWVRFVPHRRVESPHDGATREDQP